MQLLERIEFLSDISNDKRIAFAIFCCERSYLEVYKVFPAFLDKHSVFRNSIDELWNSLAKSRHLARDEWKHLDNKIHDFVEVGLDYELYKYDMIVVELARAINLAIGIFRWNDGVADPKSVASCAEKCGSIINDIYNELYHHPPGGQDVFDDGEPIAFVFKNIPELISAYEKEIEWLANVLHFIKESVESPKGYEFFRQIEDYERSEISPTYRKAVAVIKLPFVDRIRRRIVIFRFNRQG